MFPVEADTCKVPVSNSLLRCHGWGQSRENFVTVQIAKAFIFHIACKNNIKLGTSQKLTCLVLSPCDNNSKIC